VSFYIRDRKIGPDAPPYVIAELSANHNGSLERAFASIKAAKAAGADAVKIQTYTADTMTIESDRDEFQIKGGLWDGHSLYDLYKWAETPYEWHQALFDYAEKIGITLFSSPFDESAVDLLETLNTPAYKIASFEATDIPLIKYVAATGKPMIISTGMACDREISQAIEAAYDYGCQNLVLLHCISNYPTPISDANLHQIRYLQKKFDTYTGLSDHTLGNTAAVAAAALGACVVEKHFTLSRADNGPDSDFSIEPSELKHLCQSTHDAWSALGQGGLHENRVDQASKQFRRSIYIVRDLPAGHVLKAQDIRRIRPGMGLAPEYWEKLIGRRLKKDVKRGTPTSWGLFEED